MSEQQKRSLNTKDIGELQKEIMHFIDQWSHVEKIPITRKAIIEEMKTRGFLDNAVIWDLKVLLRKGYIRRSITTSNKTSYVQLRRV